MATRQVPADLSEALRANPAALRTFENLPPQAQAQWVRWVSRAWPRSRRRARIDEAVRRLGAYTGGAAAEETVEERPPPPPPPRDYWWAWLLLLLLLVIAGLLAWFFATRDNGNKVNVPRVDGLSLAQARVKLHNRGLVERVIRVKSSEPPNTVVAQTPGANRRVDKGSTVRLRVSKQSNLVIVPDVVGLKADDAERRLVQRRLVPDEKAAFSKKPRGTVIAMQPVAGKHVKPGSTVTVTVSHGRGKVAVPDVTGQSQQQATTALRNADLVPHVVQVPGSEPKGTVTAQDPQGGTQVARGTTVRINVSKGGGGGSTTTQATTTQATTTTTGGGGGGGGTASTTIPNVVGLRFAPAMTKLSSAGFRPVAAYTTSSRPQGTVLTESPNGGTTARRGARVRITVSGGSDQSTFTSIPDVVGEDEQSARSDLQDAGFQVVVLRRRVSDPTQAGTVVDEQPAAGQQAPIPGQVAIFVGSTS